MKTFTSAQIRNVALVGHGGVGKTTLAEALLADAGVIGRIGRVEDGTTVTDTEPEEIKRHLSVSTALAAFESHGVKLNLLDCPGYADFFAEVQAGLAMADLAVIVVSAVEGVEVQTEIAWEAAAALGLPRMIFINKLDRERASFDRTLDQLRTLFGAGVAPLELPVGDEHEFRGVIDLLSDTAYIYGDDGVGRAEAVPPEMANTEHVVHDALVEGIVVADDALMERYLEGDIPSFEELEKTLARGVAEATVFPVVCGSATKRIGVDRLAQFISEIAPSPLARPALHVVAGDHEEDIACDPNGEPLAVIGKTIADPFVGRVSLLKVCSAEFPHVGALFGHWHLYAFALVGCVGLVLNQSMYQHGTLAPGLTAMTISEPVSGFLLGTTAFGESMTVTGPRLTLMVIAIGLLATAVWTVATEQKDHHSEVPVHAH